MYSYFFFLISPIHARAPARTRARVRVRVGGERRKKPLEGQSVCRPRSVGSLHGQAVESRPRRPTATHVAHVCAWRVLRPTDKGGGGQGSGARHANQEAAWRDRNGESDRDAPTALVCPKAPHALASHAQPRSAPH